MKKQLNLLVMLVAMILVMNQARSAVNDDMKNRISDGISVAPIIGYDPTYKLLLGGAFFRGDTDGPVNNLDVFVYATFEDAYGLEARFTQWSQDNRFFQVKFLTSSFYDRYFGEGNETNPNSEVQIDLFKFEVDPAYWWRLDRKLAWGIISRLRYRKETGVDGNTSRRVFGEDFTPVVGVAVQLDNRDHQVLTTSGFFGQASLDIGPKFLSTRSNKEHFARLELDLRKFYALTERLVFASKFSFGTALGEPGFQHRFQLGGSRSLRGYQSNRLRGRHFYSLEAEFRYMPLRWLGLVAFGGVGDAADTDYRDYNTPKPTGGLGLRLALPPDYVARARFDFGFSLDESAFYLNFNEAF